MSRTEARITATRALRVEALEDRLTPSWSSVPPSLIAVPTAYTAATLNSSGDAAGSAAITANEVDWHKFGSVAGAYTFTATTPTSNLDTVIGVYNASGQRV